ncbi:MAG: TIGR04211 family SH3 domain-containing protein [Colwellia sp.]|nr:TIGR04211 family SH3 domain-containing protein [Colwellia sp.]
MKKHQNTKNNRFNSVFSFILFTFALPLFAAQELAPKAEQAYITDELFVYMHAGSGNNYRIVGTTNAGSQIKLTGLSENNYTQIVDENNKKTWIESKYITEQAGLRFVVAELNAQLAAATELNSQLDSQLNNVKANTSNLNDKNGQLNTEIATLKNQLATSQSKLKTQDTDVQKQWFFTGAIVLAIGLVLGLVIPRLGGRRRGGNMDNWK